MAWRESFSVIPAADNPQAVALRDWLTVEGWDDRFLDLDPSRGIAAGERWERRLYEAANRCEAILFLVSSAWLASDWCLREFRLAQKLNKRSFGILIEPIPLRDLPAELTASWQFVDLAQGTDHRIFRTVLPDGGESHVTFSASGLKRLKAGLTRAGLDARFFAWPPEDDPDRPPYRGMRPLEAGDAGIFFGREAPTIEALDRLRGLSEAAAPRFMVILGASGAGKSSFLRAGLLPRLARDDRSFLPLPIVRPERGAMSGDTGLIRSLEAAAGSAGVPQTRAEINAAIDGGSPAVAALLAALAEKVRAPAGTNEGRPHPPRIVLAIDQAEELFLAKGAAEAGTFLRLVRDLASDPASNLIVIATIRSDAYERLQTAPALEGVRQEAVSLPPMPRGAYQTVIEGPAARLAETRRPLKVEPALTQALLHDVEQGGAKDALPLLAFTLERLYLEHGGDGDLRLSEYRQVGGIRGSIDAAVEGALRGADSDPAVPRDRAAREALLRRALIPWLAGIDPETGAPRRRIARLSEIPEEARPLVTHLVASRLLATDRNSDTGETTVEPAHEALLRQWGLLQGWLEEDFAALAALEGVKRAARDWEANARAPDWLSHAAGRLDDAEALLARDDFAASLNPADRAYLTAARAADTARRDRELAEARKLAAMEKRAAEAARDAAEKQRMVARRTRIGFVAASLLAILAAGAAWYGITEARRADEQAGIAEEQAATAERETWAARMTLARMLTERTWSSIGKNRELAMRYALAGAAASDDAVLGRAALARANEDGSAIRHVSVYDDPFLFGEFAQAGDRIVTIDDRGAVALSDLGTATVLWRLPADPPAVATGFLSGGERVAVALSSGAISVRDATTGSESLAVALGSPIQFAKVSPDGSRLVTVDDTGMIGLWDTAEGAKVLTLRGNKSLLAKVIFSPDGAYMLGAFVRGPAHVWESAGGQAVAAFSRHRSTVRAAAFSPDGETVATASQDRAIFLWDVGNGRVLRELSSRWAIDTIAFSPDGARLRANDIAGNFLEWRVTDGALLRAFDGRLNGVERGIFRFDGAIFAGTGGFTSTIWEAASAHAIGQYDHGGLGGRILAINPTGTSVAIGMQNGRLDLWDFTRATEPADTLRAAACESLQPNQYAFTEFEIAADPLIQEVWLANGSSSLCASTDAR